MSPGSQHIPFLTGLSYKHHVTSFVPGKDVQGKVTPSGAHKSVAAGVLTDNRGQLNMYYCQDMSLNSSTQIINSMAEIFSGPS